jgi:hypothetical protein
MLRTINTEYLPEQHQLCGFCSGGGFFLCEIEPVLFNQFKCKSLNTLGGIHKASNPKINLHG